MDLLDFYRGTLSVRLLGVYVRQLSVKSGLVRALNDGRQPWSNTDHLLADLWAQLEAMRNPKRQSVDHPTRAEREAKARTTAKLARVVELRATFERRKKTYGLGSDVT